MTDIPREGSSPSAPPKTKGSLVLTKSQIERFLKELKQTDRSDATIDSYRQNLLAFYDFLPPDKRIDSRSLAAWQAALREKAYAPHSINCRISAVNSLYNYLGKRNWQLVNNQRPQRLEDGPVLSRSEYLHLLEEAKRQENIQLYLIVKTLACTELVPSDLILLTREAVDLGVVSGKMRGTDRDVSLPASLWDDLRAYVTYRGIRRGPVFLNRSGNAYERTAISRMIGILGSDSGLEPGKATPRNLHRLYLRTLAEFQRQADAWVSDTYAGLLKEEERNIGWQVWMPARKEA